MVNMNDEACWAGQLKKLFLAPVGVRGIIDIDAVAHAQLAKLPHIEVIAGVGLCRKAQSA